MQHRGPCRSSNDAGDGPPNPKQRVGTVPQEGLGGRMHDRPGSSHAASALPAVGATAASQDGAGTRGGTSAKQSYPMGIFHADDDATLRGVLLESELAEEQRQREDDNAERLLAGFCAQLVTASKADAAWPYSSACGGTTTTGTADTAGRQFTGLSNPARDGDCLMRCVVEHDFGSQGGHKSGAAVPPNVALGRRDPRDATTMLPASATETASPVLKMTADELRMRVVDRVREMSLAKLPAQAAACEALLEKANAAGSTREDLERELIRHRSGAAAAAVEANCLRMFKPGVVMEQDEVDALADLRGAPVEVSMCKQLSSAPEMTPPFDRKQAPPPAVAVPLTDAYILIPYCRCGVLCARKTTAVLGQP